MVANVGAVPRGIESYAKWGCGKFLLLAINGIIFRCNPAQVPLVMGLLHTVGIKSEIPDSKEKSYEKTDGNSRKLTKFRVKGNIRSNYLEKKSLTVEAR